MKNRDRKTGKKKPFKKNSNQKSSRSKAGPEWEAKSKDKLRAEAKAKIKSAPKPKPFIELEEEMRLNKYIAHCGICSRRKADEHIKNGKVKVNGEVVLEMGYKVQPKEIVTFNDKQVTPVQEMVYILLNKPKNVITSVNDERDRRTVMDFIGHLTKQRVYPIGRLDRNTTGLLLLTNDGQLAQKLSHPSHEVEKVYKATLDKPLLQSDLQKIRNTLQLEDGPAPVDAVDYVEGRGENVIGIELHIGRNRIVRRIFEHLGYVVVKLDRVRYAMLNKKTLTVGKCRKLTKKEVIVLKHLV